MPSCSSPAPSCPSPTPSYPSPTPLLPLPPAQSWAMTSRLIQRHTRNHVNRGFPASRLAGIQAGRRQSLYQTTSFCHSVSSVTSNSRPLAGSGYVASEVTAILTFLDHDHRGVGEGCVWGGVGGGGGELANPPFRSRYSHIIYVVPAFRQRSIHCLRTSTSNNIVVYFIIRHPCCTSADAKCLSLCVVSVY